MFSKFFIQRPIFACVISIVITLIGAVSGTVLPISRYPEIAPPTVEVTASYPGADAETVAETVATPLEQEINGVEDMIYMSSVSTSDGQMTLTVTFAVGTDVDMAQVLVQNRVAIAQSMLPEEVMRQGVSTKKKSVEITLLLSLYSPEGTYDDLFLNNYATLRIKDEIARVPGVGDVFIFGAGDYGMRVWLDPALMEQRDITTNDVLAAVREQNVQVAAGTIGAPPAPEGQSFQFTVNTQGRLSDPEQFEQIVIKGGEGSELTRIRDVARVELGSKSLVQNSLYNGLPSASIAIYQLPGANAIELRDEVIRTMDRLSEAFPVDVEYQNVYDSTDIIRASITEVVITLFVALILVVATVYVFLQSFRATLIPALTIPVSLVGTFTVMLALGFSFNILTLFGLVLVIGIVVDDAIVVVENVTRHLDESDVTPKEAAELAMKEVSGPVIATTLVLLAVFLPTAAMPGITGQLFRQFALTIAIATVFSSINALTLSPALAGVILRPTPKKPALPFRMFNKAFDATTNVYTRIVRLFLRIAPLGVAGFFGLVVLSGYGFSQIPSAFVPQEDEGWCFVNVQLPDGAAFARTEKVMERVSEIALSTPGVTDCITVAGFSLLDSSNSSNGGTAFVIFDNWDNRATPELHQDGIVAHLRRELGQIQEAVGVPLLTPSLPGVGNAGGFALYVQDQAATGSENLDNVVQGLIQTSQTQSAIQAMFTTFSARVPQLYADIDREQVKTMGIPLQDVFDTLGAFLGSAYVNDFSFLGRIFQVRAQADARFRAEPEDINALRVRTSDGGMVPLGSLLNVEETLGAQTVTRFNVYPAAKLNGSGAPGYSSGQTMALIEQMLGEELPSSMGYAWTDLSYQEQIAQGGTTIIFIFAIVLVYLVLAAQYESWSIPVSVVLAVPTALLGAVAGLMIGGLANDAYVQIGIVLLIGLSAKSAILIVEFAKVEREGGKSIFDAALDAARLRFRAILMTAFSFILGVLPLLLASGAGAESRISLGTTVFSGMVAATIISVVAVPMLYLVIQHISEGFGKLTGKAAPGTAENGE